MTLARLAAASMVLVLGASCASPGRLASVSPSHDVPQHRSAAGVFGSDAPILDVGTPVGDVWLAGGASPSDVWSVVSYATEPNSTHWSAFSTITVSDQPVQVISARGLTDDRVGPSEAFLAELGVDGMAGVTPHAHPGADEYPDPPSPADGYLLDANDAPAIVYIEVQIPPGFTMGHVYGAELAVMTTSGEVVELVVLSPVTLCAAGLDEDCRAEERRLLDLIGPG